MDLTNKKKTLIKQYPRFASLIDTYQGDAKGALKHLKNSVYTLTDRVDGFSDALLPTLWFRRDLSIRGEFIPNYLETVICSHAYYAPRRISLS